MTITITKRGKIPEEVVHSATCPRCQTEFTFQKSDGEALPLAPGERPSPFAPRILIIKCPLCLTLLPKEWIA